MYIIKVQELIINYIILTIRIYNENSTIYLLEYTVKFIIKDSIFHYPFK